MKKTVAVLLLALMGSAPSAFAATVAGEVLLLTGQGTATDPETGSIRALAKGNPVHAGEIISSGTNSYVNIRFTDGAFILLRPNTRFVIEGYAHSGEAAPAPAAAAPRTPAQTGPAAPPPLATAAEAPSSETSRAFFRLLRGGFRAVSGLIGKANPDDYRVSTPVATIGIRGTDYIVVLCDAACARDPVLQEELPEGAAMEGGVVANVVDGTIHVNADAAATAALPASSPFGWLGVGVLGLAAAPESESKQVEVTAGHTAAVTRKREIYVIDKIPRFLIKQPIPDPTTICQ